MIILKMKIVVLPEKQQELLQTFHAVLNKVRKEKGCRNSLFLRDTENEQIFILLERWENQRDLDRHLRSDYFGVLLGAAKLLGGQMDVDFHSLSYTAGEEAIKRARPKKAAMTDG